MPQNNWAKSAFHEAMTIVMGPYSKFRRDGQIPQASDPDDIARALRGVFDISKSERERITIVGGVECSFIAAISHWLFDLKVHVEDSKGKCLFSSSPSTDQTQIHIVYQETDQFSTTKLSESTFVLGAPRELLRCLPDERLRLVRTRIPWESCLSHTFGQSFQDLLKFPIIVGTLLGGAARIFQALAKEELDVDGFSREAFIHYVDTSYGRAFTQGLPRLFPELNDVVLLESADSALSQTVSDAISAVTTAMRSLRHKCKCYDCGQMEKAFRQYGELEEFTAHQYSQRRHNNICLNILATTILRLAVMLSSTEFEPGVQPTENGLYHIYEKQRVTQSVVDRMGAGRRAAELLAAFFGLGDVPTFAGLTAFTRDTPGGLMEETICVFTGYQLSMSELETTDFRTAVAENGICVYLDCLESMTTRPELLRRIHVIPGHISWKNRSFDSIWDCGPTHTPTLEQVVLSKSFASSGILRSHESSMGLEMTALVDEPSGPGQLALYYRITTPEGRIFIRPGEMSRYILFRAGLIVCSEPHFDESFVMQPHFVHGGWNVDDITMQELLKADRTDHVQDRHVLVWMNSKSTISRLIAIEMQQQSVRFDGLYVERIILLQQDQCLPCSTRTAEQLKLGPAERSRYNTPIIHIM